MPDPITVTFATIGAATFTITLLRLDDIGILLNEMVYKYANKEFVLRPNSGTFQRKLPLLRVANARYGFPAPPALPVPAPPALPVPAPPDQRLLEPGEVESDSEEEEEEDEKQPMHRRPYSDEDWMRSPHIRAICEYARDRPGFLSYYWCRRMVILHYLFMKWFVTIPAESYIRREGSYVPAFVELHLAHFRCGLNGRTRNRFRFDYA